jgi:8-oxo-dGTP diphosphatase
MKTSHDSEVPAHGQQVITACAFIYRQNEAGKFELFSPRRADTKRFLPGVFELPGGHIDFGEDLIVGLKREVKEEFDQEINVEECVAAFTYTNEIKGSHSIEVVFLAQFSSEPQNIELNPEDHSEYKWFTRNEYGNIVGRDQQDPEYKAVMAGFDYLELKQRAVTNA